MRLLVLLYLGMRAFTPIISYRMINPLDDAIETIPDPYGEGRSLPHATSCHYRNRYDIEAMTPTNRLHHTGNEEIISLQEVSKQYRLGNQTVSALNGITLSVNRGELIAVTGASGSGKSALLQIIGCLDKPTSGRVAILSKEVTGLSDNTLSELRQKTIGFIFQSFYLQPFLSLEDNLAVPAMFAGKANEEISTVTKQLLHRVGLADRDKHLPRELSGGQAQRAAIARALVNSPQILLADEPTGSLDSVNGQSIVKLFKTIRDTLGTTIIIVTHDAVIARQSDRIIELKDGIIV